MFFISSFVDLLCTGLYVAFLSSLNKLILSIIWRYRLNCIIYKWQQRRDMLITHSTQRKSSGNSYNNNYNNANNSSDDDKITFLKPLSLRPYQTNSLSPSSSPFLFPFLSLFACLPRPLPRPLSISTFLAPFQTPFSFPFLRVFFCLSLSCAISVPLLQFNFVCTVRA